MWINWLPDCMLIIDVRNYDSPESLAKELNGIVATVVYMTNCLNGKSDR